MASIAVETIMGHWKVDAQGISTIDGLTFQIQNGKRVIVWPKHAAEAKYILPAHVAGARSELIRTVRREINGQAVDEGLIIRDTYKRCAARRLEAELAQLSATIPKWT
jgi:hypothetical protein